MQDQYSTAFGGLNKIEFYKKKVKVKKINTSEINLKKFNKQLALFYTGINRKADNILSKIKNLEINLLILKNYQIAQNFEKIIK